jgi:non-specific serine/threonine protein kinase
MSERHATAPALTARELEIASLIAEGLSDKAIAKRLFRSARTVEYHVLQIRNKLGLENRTQIATWFTRRASGELPDGEPAGPAPDNLPTPLTRFIGRHLELTQVRSLLRATRLLTVTGPGGCGKTRLALEIVSGLRERYAAGTWFVDLSALRDPERMAAEVADQLGSGRAADGGPLDAVLSVLGDDRSARARLLVLDNVEHVVEACGPLAEGLLRSCAPLSVLCTGREPLHVTGEVIWRLGPLGLPEPAPTSPARATASDAVRLFVDRAGLVVPDFALDDRNVTAVVEIVRRLDGIPLALELAAGQLGPLSVERLLDHLDDHFVLAGRRGLVSRQRTMAATIHWSESLLSEAERRLFRRLAVFRGPFTLQAAEAVCGDPDEAGATLEPLSALADKSLVVVGPDGDRYRLLETIRAYAWDRLRDSGELDGVRRRHYDHFLAWSQPTAERLRGPDQATWLARLAEAHDNLRAALDYGREEGLDSVLGFALALERFWFIRGHGGEGRRWLEELVELDDRPTRQRAMALVALAKLTWGRAEPPAPRRSIERSLAIFRQLDDRDGVQLCLNHLGSLALTEGEAARARDLYQECLTLASPAADERTVAFLHGNLGVAAILLHDHDAAQSHLATALAMLRRLGDPYEVANVLTNAGSLERDRGRLAVAAARYLESLDTLRELGASVNLIECLEGIACVAAAGGAHARALRLAAAASALRERLGAPASGVVRRLIPLDPDALRARLPRTTARRAWTSGMGLTLDEVVDLARFERPLQNQ